MAPGSPKAGVYCQTKFGVRGLTQALGTLYIMPHSKFINRPSALELAQTGITVNYSAQVSRQSVYCPQVLIDAFYTSSVKVGRIRK